MSTGYQKYFFRYVNMSVCQYVRMQLFSLGIKMKVVQNVIRMSASHYGIMSIHQYVSMSIFQYVSMDLDRTWSMLIRATSRVIVLPCTRESICRPQNTWPRILRDEYKRPVAAVNPFHHIPKYSQVFMS